jgi:predicted RNA-binding protein with PUA domain
MPIGGNMLNWDDYYNEDAPVKKDEVQKDEKQVLPDPKLQKVEEVNEPQSDVIVAEQNSSTEEVGSTLTDEDLKLAKEDLDTLEGRVQVDQKAMINSRADLNQ